MFYLNSVIGYNAIWSHNHEIANLLSKKGKVYWLDPIKVKGYPHFEKINENINLQNIEVINKDLFCKNLGVKYLLKQEFESVRNLWKLRKDIEFYINYSPLGNLLAFFLAKILKKKVISFYVDDYVELSVNKIVKVFLKIISPLWFKLSNKVFCTAKVLENTAKKYNKNTYYFPNGVNIKKLGKSNFKELNEIKSIGFVGALGNWVDGKIIIDLAKKFKNLKIEIVGDGVIFNFLKKEKDNNNLNNLILYGFKSHKEALEIIKNTDVTIIPFKVNKITDAVSPVKLFEYWSLGKTSIVSNTLELQQFKNELFIYKNEEELFQIIESLNKNIDIVNLKVKNSLDKLEEFNWGGKLGDNILKLILS